MALRRLVGDLGSLMLETSMQTLSATRQHAKKRAPVLLPTSEIQRDVVSPSGTKTDRPLTSVRAGQGPFFVVWRVLGSNQRRRTPADLQSAPFGHSGNPPCQPWDLAILPADARIARRWGLARIGPH